MDIITTSFERFFAWVWYLDPSIFNFFLKAALVFGLPCIFCGWALSRGNRSIMIQALWLAIGILLAALIPVQNLHIENRTLKGWYFALSAVLLLFLPGILPSLIVPRFGTQRKLRVLFYAVLLTLFLTNLYRNRGAS